MNLQSILPCMAIVVVGFSCALAHGRAFGGEVETSVPRETEGQRGGTARSTKEAGRTLNYSAARSVETESAVKAVNVRTERSRRDESDERFRVLMLFLQILRGPK